MVSPLCLGSDTPSWAASLLGCLAHPISSLTCHPGLLRCGPALPTQAPVPDSRLPFYGNIFITLLRLQRLVPGHPIAWASSSPAWAPTSHASPPSHTCPHHPAFTQTLHTMLPLCGTPSSYSRDPTACAGPIPAVHALLAMLGLQLLWLAHPSLLLPSLCGCFPNLSGLDLPFWVTVIQGHPSSSAWASVLNIRVLLLWGYSPRPT